LAKKRRKLVAGKSAMVAVGQDQMAAAMGKR